MQRKHGGWLLRTLILREGAWGDRLGTVMATATIPEQAEPRAARLAEPLIRAQPDEPVTRRAWVRLDSGFATIVAIAALAIAAFTYLNIRIDNVAGELRGEIRSVNTRIDTLSSEMSGKLDKVSDEMKRYAERTDARFEQFSAEMKRNSERTDAKLEQLSAEMKRYAERTDARFEQFSTEVKRNSERNDDKIDRLTDKINELLIDQRRGQ